VAAGYVSAGDRVLGLLGDGRPRRAGEVAGLLGIGLTTASTHLGRLWKQGKVLRTKEPVFEYGSSFHGRAGYVRNLRHYHLYIGKGDGASSPVVVDGREYVGYSSGKKGKSKSQLVLDYLKAHKGGAFFSADIYDALKDQGVKKGTVSYAIRYYEKKGSVFVRGYRSHSNKTPFQRGFLVTWIDRDKPRETALNEALKRTEEALGGRARKATLLERVRFIRDIIISTTHQNDLTSEEYLESQLGCTREELRNAVKRALQLYPDLQNVKIFNAFNYYYHNSMPEAELNAAVTLKENYIRKVKGADNRIGHNWEAVAEWFIDTFTTGAKFREQKHRKGGMDPRRITLFLVKNVGDRKNRAEVDRVWEVAPSPLAKPITYVLSCKYGLVHKKDLDDFFNVLKNSKEFGVDTPEGRARKENVIGMFAGSTFSPDEKVHLPDGTAISLSSYAERLNIQLLKESDLNERLREKGVDKKITVQRICSVSKDEKEGRTVLDEIWKTPEKAQEILNATIQRNLNLYQFERQLKYEEGDDAGSKTTTGEATPNIATNDVMDD